MGKTQASNIKRVVVEFDACRGAGACVRLYPLMFQLADEEQEKAVTQMEEGWDDGRLMEAARACPNRAIILIDTHQRQACLR